MQLFKSSPRVERKTKLFVHGCYLFLEAHSFPKASLLQNCSLLATDNVRRQLCEMFFAPEQLYCIFRYRYRFPLKYFIVNFAAYQYFALLNFLHSFFLW